MEFRNNYTPLAKSLIYNNLHHTGRCRWVYVHEKIPWERIRRMMVNSETVSHKGLSTTISTSPTSPFVCKLLIMNDLMWGR